MNLKGALANVLTKEEIAILRRGFDIIGDIAIIEIPEELSDKEMIIAKAIRDIHKNVSTVLRKMSERKGAYRLREFKRLMGNKTETLHKEYGMLLKLDVTRAYFSPRESEERQRIAGMVKPGERVMVMFAGIGPYAIAIAKKQPGVEKIYAVELNPDAYEYMVENIRINKVAHKVAPVLGDAREEARKHKGEFDRVVMPLPKGAHEFLQDAIFCLKNGGVVHFYHWAHEDDLYEEAIRLAEDAARAMGRNIEVIGKRKVLPYASRVWKICIDFIVR